MSYAIVYSSRTGNTERLARAALEALGAEGCSYFGAPGPDASAAASAADLVLLGSWTDKGGLDPALDPVLPSLPGHSVFLFGTCGFGGDPAYFDRVLDNFSAALPDGTKVIGRYLCQGQMPPSVRERYVSMSERDPDRFAPMIENFDRAVGHPDEADLEGLVRALRDALPDDEGARHSGRP